LGKAPRIVNVSIAIVIALTTLVFTSRALPTSARSSHASMKTLRLEYYAGANGSLASFLDPAQIGAAEDYDTASLIYRGLVIIGTNDQVQKDLASKIKVSKDLKTYTFTLRKGLKFQNGDKITASTVVSSIKRALSPKTNSTVNYYDDLLQNYDAFSTGKSKNLGVKAVNKSTVQVKISKPAAYFLKAFTYPINDVLDPKAVNGKNAGQNNNYLTNTCKANVSNGPFKLVCLNGSTGPGSFYSTGSTPKYTFVPNPKFYGPKPHIKIVMPAIGTADTAYKDYLANQQIDVTGIPTANLAAARHRPDFHQAPTSTIGYISLNTKDAPFNNKNCRLAVAYSLNRKTLMAVIHNASNPLYTILPPGFPGYTKSILKKIPTYNASKAKSYFKKCGSGASTPFKYVYNSSSSDSDHLALAITQQMDAVGFHATPQGTTVSDWYHDVSHTLSSTGTAAIRNGWAQDYPDPQDYISLLFRCGNTYDIGEWCNSQFDKLVDKADVTKNGKARDALYAKAQQIALNNGVPVPYDNGVDHFLIRRTVHGMVATIAWSDVVPQGLNWSKVSIS
jgi:oligopeptide transport system substrate-binding protein